MRTVTPEVHVANKLMESGYLKCIWHSLSRQMGQIHNKQTKIKETDKWKNNNKQTNNRNEQKHTEHVHNISLHTKQTITD